MLLHIYSDLFLNMFTMFWWFRIQADLQQLKILIEQRERYVDELENNNEKLKKELESKKKVIKYYRKEKKRLTNLVNKLHADCFYYENHWQPKPWEDEAEECPFI